VRRRHRRHTSEPKQAGPRAKPEARIVPRMDLYEAAIMSPARKSIISSLTGLQARVGVAIASYQA
jgi:hypothetical protein